MKQRIENYEIEASDDRNYTVNKIAIVKDGDNAGKESRSFVGYYNSIESAVKEIARLCANDQPDLKTWLIEYKAIIRVASALMA